VVFTRCAGSTTGYSLESLRDSPMSRIECSHRVSGLVLYRPDWSEEVISIHTGAAPQQAAGFERQQAAAVRVSDGWVRALG
jgi:hypothetical protein